MKFTANVVRGTAMRSNARIKIYAAFRLVISAKATHPLSVNE